MEQFTERESTREEIKNKLRQNFDGKIVRKDLTKKIKEGANVPVYVLEFLLGQYCSSDDENVIEKGVQTVKRILADNFVRPDESQKILSQLCKKGSHTIIDMVTVRLDMKRDCFFAEFSNLGIDNVPIADEYPEKFDRLLCGGIWCIVQLDYEVEGDNNFGIEDINGNPLRSKQKKQKDISPISIRKLTPIQMPHIDIDELKQGLKAFSKDEWLDILLRSIGMEPDEFTYREKYVNFSYIDLDTFEERFVSVPEQGSGKLIPDGICNPGQVYMISQGKSGMIGVFRLESQMLPGNGKFDRTGLGSDRDCKESTNTAFNFLKANGNRISGSISTTLKDYIINYQDLQGIGMAGKLALPTLIALCSIALGRSTVSTLAVLGEISISGTLLKVDELANSLQVCLDSGAKKVLLPITSAADLGTVPPELIGSFNLIFYSSAVDAVFKALGVE